MTIRFTAILWMAFLLASCGAANMEGFAERLAAGETRAIETLQKGFRAYCKVPTVARERVRAALNVDPHFDVIVTCKNS